MNGTARIRAWTIRRTRASIIDSIGHSHALPTMLLTLVGICIAGLVLSVVIVARLGLHNDERISQLEEYVAGRSAQRDAENRELNERIDEGLCDLLDTIPAYPSTAAARVEFGCGPGAIPAPN